MISIQISRCPTESRDLYQDGVCQVANNGGCVVFLYKQSVGGKVRRFDNCFGCVGLIGFFFRLSTSMIWLTGLLDVRHASTCEI